MPKKPTMRPEAMASRGLVKFVRQHLVSTEYAEIVDLRGKTIVVTGASPGSLGFATAETLAKWGASVIVTTRSNPDAAAEAIRSRLVTPEDGARVHAHPLDLGSRESVVGFVRWLEDAHGDRLDVLVNNAGVHLDLLSRWKEPQQTEDGFEIHWRINYLGTAQLTQLLLPLLQKTGATTGAARVVNVSSKLHVKGSNEDLFGQTRPYNSWNAYGNSKLALIHMANELQRRYATESNLSAYSLHPGSVFTHVADKGLEGTGFAEKLRNALWPVEAFFLKTPTEGAQTQIHCATWPKLEGGLYYEDCNPSEPSDDAKDADVAARLWDSTLRWIETGS
jgi:NAD(P)-dependent dehydrogenase (short-subunit alcohol dehydrogenase family)